MRGSSSHCPLFIENDSAQLCPRQVDDVHTFLGADADDATTSTFGWR